MKAIKSFEEIPGALNFIISELSELRKLVTAAPASPVQPEERYLTRQEVAELLRISLPTLNELTKDGAIPSYRIGNSTSVRYKSSEIEKALTNTTPTIKMQKEI